MYFRYRKIFFVIHIENSCHLNGLWKFLLLPARINEPHMATGNVFVYCMWADTAVYVEDSVWEQLLKGCEENQL
jgi:hypothetical protein